VARALMKDPRDRFPSMDAFAAELEACLQELRTGTTQDPAATVITAPVPRRAPAKPPRARRRGTPAPLLVALVALAALAVIAVAALAVHGNHIPGTSSSGNSGAGGGGGGGGPVTLSAATGFDPQGDHAEHNADAPNATDGNAATFWTTEHYGSPNFGGLKDGVGLVLNAPGPVALKTLTVTTDTPGFSALVKAGSSPESAQPVSSEQTLGPKTTFDLTGGKASVYVLWITRLSASGVAHVNEISAAS